MKMMMCAMNWTSMTKTLLAIWNSKQKNTRKTLAFKGKLPKQFSCHEGSFDDLKDAVPWVRIESILTIVALHTIIQPTLQISSAHT